MKKLLSLLLGLALMLGCAAMAEMTVDYTGEWVMTGAEMGGAAVDLSLLNISASMTINEDGTCVLTMMGEAENGTWAAGEDGLTVTDASGEAGTYVLADGKLSVNREGVTMIFSRPAVEETVAAAVPADASAYIGAWELTSGMANGVTVDVSTLNLTMHAYINEDGTCELITQGVSETGTWALAEGGIALTDELGDSFIFTLKDGALTTEMSGVTLVLTPMTDEAEAYVMPLSGLSVADFNGDWTFVYAEYMGQTLAPELLGLSMSLQIADGAGHMEMSHSEGSETQDAVCQVEEIEGLGTVMYFLYVDPTTGAATQNGLVLFLYSDGELVWYTSDEEGNDIFYCFLPEALLEEEAAE